MAKATLVVLSNPVSPDQEDAYNEWYDNVHLADVLKVPGFVAAERYRLVDLEVMPGAPKPAHRYLALYEVEAEDVAAASAAMMARAGTDAMPLSDALDVEGTSAFFYEPIGAPVVAEPA